VSLDNFVAGRHIVSPCKYLTLQRKKFLPESLSRKKHIGAQIIYTTKTNS